MNDLVQPPPGGPNSCRLAFGRSAIKFHFMRVESIHSELDRILSLVGLDPSVERVYLFGSAADDERIHEESDIDLCIVQHTDLRFYDRLAEWIDRIRPEIGLDLVVYTPEEFEQMKKQNYFVRSEIAQKGKEIYHAA